MTYSIILDTNIIFKDYFLANFEYDKEKLQDELHQFLEKKDYIQNSIDDMLLNSEFEGEYFTGWGTDAYIEDYTVSINGISLDIEENVLLVSFEIEANVSFNIETVDPSYERGDSGDGMLSENSTTDVLIQANVTYLIDEDKLIDYVELDSEYI